MKFYSFHLLSISSLKNIHVKAVNINTLAFQPGFNIYLYPFLMAKQQMVRLKAPIPWGFKIGKDMRRNQREKSKTDVVKLLLMLRHGRMSRCLPTPPISSAKVLATCGRLEGGVCFSEHGWNVSLGFECKLKGKWLTGSFFIPSWSYIRKTPTYSPKYILYLQTNLLAGFFWKLFLLKTASNSLDL